MNEEEFKAIKYFLTEEQLVDYTRKVVELIQDDGTFELWEAEDRLGEETNKDAWYFYDVYGNPITTEELLND
jgi:hypothetical protein